VNLVRAIDGNVLLFSHGSFLRVLAGRLFFLRPASLRALGYEEIRSQPVIRLWDDICHLETCARSQTDLLERRRS
jgi:broad specificity phosphatase PhoE